MASARRERIGFIGLGIMGAPMAANLLRAGHPLVVHNRSRAPVERLVAAGAAAAGGPREVAERADVVITMLPDSPDVETVVLGPGGVAEGLVAGQLLIDMSTVAPATARRLAEAAAARGAAALDAPVSGGQAGAEQGTLSIMVGGDETAFERALPILQVLGSNVVRIGGPGTGQIAKAANQMIVADTIAAVAEALLLAARAGADPARVRQALLGGFAGSRILEVHGERMLRRAFTPGFRLRLQLKDVRIAVDTARQAGMPLPMTERVFDLLGEVVSGGAGELDHSALLTALEARVGIRLTPGQPS
jgi:2-hydroxy-3-oxopropionate reductase